MPDNALSKLADGSRSLLSCLKNSCTSARIVSGLILQGPVVVYSVRGIHSSISYSVPPLSATAFIFAILPIVRPISIAGAKQYILTSSLPKYSRIMRPNSCSKLAILFILAISTICPNTGISVPVRNLPQVRITTRPCCLTNDSIYLPIVIVFGHSFSKV